MESPVNRTPETRKAWRSPLRIFISFKTEERDHALRLKKAMNDEGYEVWWQEEIQCGREWHGELDSALADAGAVVVLWTGSSMHSPWVRHEASQAVVRGTYTPARLDSIEIESPYNRTQATDLIHWNGDRKHPGFRNLLARIAELMPPPPSVSDQLRRFIWRWGSTCVASAIAVAGMLLLQKQSRLMEIQSQKQSEIVNEIKRSLQPIQDLDLKVTLNVNPGTCGLSEYIARLTAGFPSLRLRGIRGARPEAGIGYGDPVVDEDGPYLLQFEERSGYWPGYVNVLPQPSEGKPAEDSSRCLQAVTSSIQLKCLLWATNRLNDPIRTESDLSFPIVINLTNTKAVTVLTWDRRSDSICLSFQTTVGPKDYWKSKDGNIVSALDIDRAIIGIAVSSSSVRSSDENSEARKALESLTISKVELSYSGRHRQDYNPSMKRSQTKDGWPLHLKAVSDLK